MRAGVYAEVCEGMRMAVFLCVVSVFLHAALVGFLGLPWAFAGLAFDLAVRFLARRYFRGGWLALSAVLGVLAGVILYAGGELDALLAAAVFLVCIFRGGLVLML